MTNEQLMRLLRMMEAIRLGIRANTLVVLSNQAAAHRVDNRPEYERLREEVSEASGRSIGLSEIALEK